VNPNLLKSELESVPEEEIEDLEDFLIEEFD
jgi:hypothetical protein